MSSCMGSSANPFLSCGVTATVERCFSIDKETGDLQHPAGQSSSRDWFSVVVLARAHLEQEKSKRGSALQGLKRKAATDNLDQLERKRKMLPEVSKCWLKKQRPRLRA
ncbi:hypothetical protein N1851_021910 [Merluccius polli]|uniref:Uncharacterized protein n=1 Tax=Merluccius polli TaxID=89951 RepID=A0AA47NY41_MERPO|nr:hypothetical protein N1851_021910 [Merluccius polli]